MMFGNICKVKSTLSSSKSHTEKKTKQNPELIKKIDEVHE